jgi:hypothetical protein
MDARSFIAPRLDDTEQRLEWKIAGMLNAIGGKIGSLGAPPASVCVWYAADANTAESPADYLAYTSFSAALAATAGYTQPDLVWGSVEAYWNADGSAPYVDITLSPPGPPSPEFVWAWTIGIVGNADADIGGANTAQLALSGVQASLYLPAGFCPAPTP